MAKHCPTFVLRGVDFEKLLKSYNAGSFSVERPLNGKIKLMQNSTLIAPKYGCSNLDPVYTIKDKNNADIVVATSGHEDYKTYVMENKLPDGGRCDVCKIDFTHKPIGCPIKMQIDYMLIPAESGNPDDAIYQIVYYIWVEGTCCDFRCQLYYIMEEQKKIYSHRDPNLKHAEENLRFLFSLMYPDAPRLMPCNNPRLLQSNRGSLTRSEWQDKNFYYKDTQRVYIIPVKRDFVQQSSY